MSTRKPKFDEVLDGVRVRVFSTRSEFEVVFNDDDIDDPSAQVLCYPKFLGVNTSAHQARLEYVPEVTKLTSASPVREVGVERSHSVGVDTESID